MTEGEREEVDIQQYLDILVANALVDGAAKVAVQWQSVGKCLHV